jgi:Glycine-zipper domain
MVGRQREPQHGPESRRPRRAYEILVAVIGLSILVAGCVTVPTGPSVMVLPGSGKVFEQFQVDDALCRQWALQQTGVAPGEAATNSAVTSAAVGTVLGAALGAAIGAAAGNPALGAAAGAGAGLFGGSAVGANAAYASGTALQYRYDAAYQQCMYAKGNQIPAVVQTPRPARSVYVAPPAPPPPPPPAPPGYSQPPPPAPPSYSQPPPPPPPSYSQPLPPAPPNYSQPPPPAPPSYSPPPPPAR